MASRPRPIIVPSPGLSSSRESQSFQGSVDTGAIMDFLDRINRPETRRDETQDLIDVLSTLSPELTQAQDISAGELPITREQAQGFGQAQQGPGAGVEALVSSLLTPEAEFAAGVNLPEGEGGQIPTPLLQSLANLGGGSEAGLEQLRKFVGGGVKRATTPAAPGAAFAKINPKDFTPESVAEFQETGDFSKLKATRPDNVIALANKVDSTKFSKKSFAAFQESLRAGRPDLTLLELDTKEIEKRTRGGKTVGEIEQSLRKEFTTASKDFVQIRDSFTRINATAQNPSPAGDLAFIFNYMKMLDPGSVVRESEFRTAADAQEFMERKGFTSDALKRIWVGERLSDAARQDFLNKSREIFDGMDSLQGKNEETFRRLATDRKVNPDNVAIDLGLAEDNAEFDSIDAEIADIERQLKELK